MSKNVLVVSAHPDDETLGVGGTLLRHSERGDRVTWLIITGLYEELGFSLEQIKRRKKEVQRVADEYRFDHTVTLDYPATNLASTDLNNLIGDISRVFREHEPEYLYTLNRSDIHSDHRLIFEAVMACTKSFRYPSIREVLMYECISETEFSAPLPENSFLPNCYVDITEQMDKKIEIMNIFESEMGHHPFPRSERNLRALATFRGATAGVEYAEAFQILKSYRFETL